MATLQNWLLVHWTSFSEAFYLNFIKAGRWHYLVNGLWVTLLVAFFAILIGAVLGFLVAIIRSTHDKHGRLRVLNFLCKIYLTVIRGTPMVVQLLIGYFVIFATFNVFEKPLYDKVFIAAVMFGVNSGAYVAEIIRSGISSIDTGQMEAGRSLGLSYLQTLQFIILPQAVKNVLPALGNEFIVLLKETSVAGYIALPDLTKGGDIIRSQTYSAFLPFFAVAAVYLVLVMVFTSLLSKLERRLQTHA